MLNDSLLEIQPLSDEELDLTPVDPNTEQLPSTKEEKKKEKEEAPKENKSTPLSPNEIPDLTDEELEEEDLEEKEIEEKKEEKPKKLTKEKKEKAKDVIDYKQMVDALVEDGDWVDFEGREEIEYTAEVYKDLMKNQAKWKAEQELEDQKASMGREAKELLEHLKNGGSVQDLYESFQQQEDIESYDTSKIEDAEKVLRIYGESLDWDKSEIEDYIETEKDKGEDKFKTLAEKRKGSLLKIVQEEREQIKEAQIKRAEAQKALQEQSNKAILTEIHSLDLTEREKKELEKFQFEYKYQDNQGNKYTEAGVKYQEIVNNPKKYAKLLMMIKNFDDMEDKTKTANAVKKQQYTWMKKGQDLNGNKSSESPEFIQSSKGAQRNIFRPL